MELENFELKEGNHFVAMEYYRLISNRTFLVLIGDEHLYGILGNGLISVKWISERDKKLANATVVQNNLDNPYAYLNKDFWNHIQEDPVNWSNLLDYHKSNFKIRLDSITAVTYNSKKKWGMSYYPHDGKVYVHYDQKKKKEFIILGNQSGEQIKNWIEGRI